MILAEHRHNPNPNSRSRQPSQEPLLRHPQSQSHLSPRNHTLGTQYTTAGIRDTGYLDTCSMAPIGHKYKPVAGDDRTGSSAHADDSAPYDKDYRDSIDDDASRPKRRPSRAIRYFLCFAVTSFLFATFCPSSLRPSYDSVSQSLGHPPRTLEEKARHILTSSPLIGMYTHTSQVEFSSCTEL